MIVGSVPTRCWSFFLFLSFFQLSSNSGVFQQSQILACEVKAVKIVALLRCLGRNRLK